MIVVKPAVNGVNAMLKLVGADPIIYPQKVILNRGYSGSLMNIQKDWLFIAPNIGN